MPKYRRNCDVCSRHYFGQGKKFCSWKCYKFGAFAWNKNIPCSNEHKEAISKANKGKHYSPKTELKKGHKLTPRGNKNPNWLGKNASYSTKHKWLVRQVGSASLHKCKYCIKQAKDWANISHKYKRDIKDYFPLCRKCHIAYDRL